MYNKILTLHFLVATDVHSTAQEGQPAADAEEGTGREGGRGKGGVRESESSMFWFRVE